MARKHHLNRCILTKLIAISIIALLSCIGRNEGDASLQRSSGEGYTYVTYPEKNSLNKSMQSNQNF
ncbi:hypothetical protein OKW21_004778 [Catalinimonas alkaloidigena]|uniref:hypothetical protein n=1 Tax=Catalinimonas alkaloidigena TaxID=1075417 RepID=UPI002405417B|nr:hypothetical protein [Catalinimonas alkaloidigena]MDF9799515.1 hypothetical protein [Catalinimonas alkaloidigena]